MSFEIESALREHADGITKLTQDTKSELAKGRAETQRLVEDYKSLADQVRCLAQKGGVSMEVRSSPRHPFDCFTKSEELASLRKRSNMPNSVRSVSVELSDVSIKSVLTSTQFSEGSPTTTVDVQAQRDNGIYANPRRTLRLLDVLRRLPVSSNAFEYHRLSGYTNAASYQTAEGVQKPEGSVDTSLQTAKIHTIAHFLPVSKQLLDDQPALQQQLDDLFRYGVIDKLENAIINDTGGSEIDGLINSGTSFMHTNGADAADRISEAAAYLESIGWNASAVVINPTDWHHLRTTKGAGDGQYMVGTWNMPAQPTMWGLPVVASAAMPATQAIVMDGSQVLLLDRMQPQVSMGFDGNDFTSNRMTLLAELRAGLAVVSPTAVQVLELYGSP